MLENLHEAGGITAKKMSEFDDDCLIPEAKPLTQRKTTRTAVTAPRSKNAAAAYAHPKA
jgi:hypothetical protein